MLDTNVNRPDFAWLNESSRIFLHRGYLLEGTEPEDRIRYIADHAEKLLNYPGFADKFYHYMARGYYSLASPIWSNFGLDRGLPISCVTGDTWINTNNGGKQAKDIVVGDMVLTHKNRYRPVTKVIPTKDKGDIYRLKIGTRMTNLHITGNHPVLTNMGWVKVEDLDKTRHLVAVNGQIEHVEKDYVIDMKEFVDYDFYVEDGFIIKKNLGVRADSPDNKYYARPCEFVELDQDLSWALGLWFAEGSLTTSNIKVNGVAKPNGVRVTLNMKDGDLGERWIKTMVNKFNIIAQSYGSEVVRNGKLNSWFNINVNSVVIGKFFDSFGRGCKIKQIPEWMLSSSKENLQAFLDGILAGDGTEKKDTVSLTLSNPVLALQVYQIGLILGHDMSLQMQEKAGKLSTTPYVYIVAFRGYVNSLSINNIRSGVKFQDGLTYCPIITLEKTDKVEDVYDFTVEEDHSFSCAGVIVHNCFGSYIGDSIYDIMSTTAEVGMMSKTGGGTSGYFGAIRPRGAPIKDNGHSDGSFNFAKLFDTVIDVISQGTCYEEGTEVLTDKGFKDFRDVVRGKDKLAQVDEFGKISFTEHYDLIEENYSGPMYHFKGKKRESLIDISVTPNHRMVVEQQGGNTLGRVGKYWPGTTEIVKAEDLNLGTWNKMYVAGESSYDGPDLSYADRLRIAFQADGRKDGPNRKIRFRFIKQRKIDRLLLICEQLGIVPEVKNTEDGAVEISIPHTEELKKDDFSWIDITKVSRKWCHEFINELTHWDGTISKSGFRLYHTTSKANAEIAQAIGAMSFQRTRVSVINREDEGKQDLYRVGFGYIGWVKGDSIEKETKMYNGKVYCATVYTGRLLVRRNGRVLVCGNSRKGQFAGYIDIEHPDIEEWLDIHKEGNPIQLMYYGVCIGDQWLKEMKEGDAEKRRIWAKVLQRKAESGIPYLFFKDNVNNQKPDVYKDKDMTIYASNLCSEIALPSSLEESFVCCLSSMNALYFDEWKDTDAVETMTYFLDAVMEEFIQKSKSIPMMEKAHRFASRHRAIGIGVLGWHSYLQYKHTPFESFQAMQLNNELFKTIHDRSYAASREMAERYGEPEILRGYGRRNTTTMSVAPTKSSSFILGGVSPSVEPIRSNYYIKDLAKIKTTYRNPLLTKVLQEKGLDNEATWQSILVNDGSVQHLEGLSDEDKAVFKTWQEISQLTIIQQAAQRQKYIDQGQSINILVHPDTPTKDINQLYLTAHELGMKSIYYQFSMSAAQKFNRALLNTCTTCES